MERADWGWGNGVDRRNHLANGSTADRQTGFGCGFWGGDDYDRLCI